MTAGSKFFDLAVTRRYLEQERCPASAETGRSLSFGGAGLGRGQERTQHSRLLTSIGRVMGLDMASFGNISDEGPLPGIG
jgi:hypothetical protein